MIKRIEDLGEKCSKKFEELENNFMREPDRLAELSRIIQSGRAGNITEAIRVYEEGEK